MSREGNLVKSTLILSIGTVLPRLATFVVLPIVTAGLTKEEYGTYDLILVLLSLLLPAVTLQIHTAAFRFIIDVIENREECKTIISSIFCFVIPTSCAALLILYFCLYKFDPVIRGLVCVFLLADIIAVTCQWAVRGLKQNLKYSISAILNAFGRMIFCIICVGWLKMGLKGALISQIAAYTATLMYLYIGGKIYKYIDIKSVSAKKIKEMILYSWPLVPNSLAMWIMRVSDRLVVTAVMGVTANAVYAVANKLPQILNVAQSTFTMAWQENAIVTSKDDDASEYYSLMFSRMYDFMAGSLGLLVAAIPLLFKVLIHGDYDEAYKQIPILLLAMFFSTLSAYLGGIYVAYKKTKSIGLTTLAAAACNLLVDVALIKYIGLYAASGSTLVSFLLLVVYRMLDVKKFAHIHYNYVRIACVFMLVIVECTFCYLQKPVFDIINVIFGITVFAVLNRTIIKVLIAKGRRMFSKA